MTTFEPQDIRADFPALLPRPGEPGPVYLDSACMTLRPRAVLRAMERYYAELAGCHGRTGHSFGERTTEAFDGARAELARFFGVAEPQELLFVRNATEAINLVASGVAWQRGDMVLGSAIEHNSNLLPWQRLRNERGVGYLVAPVHDDTTLDLERFDDLLETPGLRLVSVLACSNLTGVSFPLRRIVEAAHARGVLVMVDAAQAGLHAELDLHELGVDFCAVSSHKMLGPTGFGMLYVRRRHLEALRPLVVGGETVLDASYETHRPAPSPHRFEAGLQDYAGALGAAAAARYLGGLGRAAVRDHLVRTNRRASEGIQQLPGVRILGPADPEARAGILNMVIDGIPARDVARVLDASHGLMLRSGRQCVHAWYGATGTPDSLRASFGPYNTLAEADLLVETLGLVLRHFR